MGLGERQRHGRDPAKCKELEVLMRGMGHSHHGLLTGGPGRPGNPSSPSRPGTPSSPFIPWTPGTPGCPRSPGKELHENLPIPGPPDCSLSQEGLSHGELTFGGYCSGVSLDSLGSRKSSDAWGSLWTEIHGCLFCLQLLEDHYAIQFVGGCLLERALHNAGTGHLLGRGSPAAVPSQWRASLALWTVELRNRPFHSEN